MGKLKKSVLKEQWYYTTAKGRNQKQELISHFGNPAFVNVVRESSKALTIKSASIAAKKKKETRKKTAT